MSMSFSGPGDDGVALATATEALDTAVEAREMVRRRDPKLNTAADDAATAASNYAAILQLSKDYQDQLATSIADRKALHDTIDALTLRIKALEDRQPAFAWQATTALTLLATKDYTLTLNRPMPSATYTAKVFVDPAAAGKLGVVVTAQTSTTVTVRTTGLVAIGVAGFGVVCWT